MSKSKFIGSTLIIAGTAFGAGMLALPMVSAAAGLLRASLLLVFVWVVMTYTGLLILEVNLAFKPRENNFSTMANATLGIGGKIVAWIACIALLYSLTAAYIAGNASLLSIGIHAAFNIHIPAWLCALSFTVVLGGAVFWSTKTVDILNRGLLSIKGILFIFAIIFLMPHIKIQNFDTTIAASKYLFACAPIFLCAFGFHHIIPSLTNYVGAKPKTLKWIIICGATIPLIIYMLWLITTLGIMPIFGTHSFIVLAKTKGSVGEFVHLLILITHSKWVNFSINGFANIAMTTSFLGVTLGLFDFLADSCKRSNTRIGRLQTASLTFF